MSSRVNAFDRFLENMDLRDTELTYRHSNKFGNNCEWCGRIRRSKKCEGEMTESESIESFLNGLSQEKIKSNVYAYLNLFLKDFLEGKEDDFLNIDFCRFNKDIRDKMLENMADYVTGCVKMLNDDKEFMEKFGGREDTFDYLVTFIIQGFLMNILQIVIFGFPAFMRSLLKAAENNGEEI